MESSHKSANKQAAEEEIQMLSELIGVKSAISLVTKEMEINNETIIY